MLIVISSPNFCAQNKYIYSLLFLIWLLDVTHVCFNHRDCHRESKRRSKNKRISSKTNFSLINEAILYFLKESARFSSFVKVSYKNVCWPKENLKKNGSLTSFVIFSWISVQLLFLYHISISKKQTAGYANFVWLDVGWCCICLQSSLWLDIHYYHKSTYFTWIFTSFCHSFVR